ncbi:uncharacterized protein J7T54_005203 [Emericellopsis cladophorae]|uniref:Extracellular membrane protein CFEM domain-containing protein n=1 Tax=Emericellopsis cladophorae TaxID=2686198 RepID=A0A9Q0BCR2_9HYPO|nr:uncharacterized protein J7T54_005203 [Emericellopsis cladophorae]KAI6779389.1 hypothetical protein J7T54_005203 [Emericellopsis cladophorae]
MAATAQDDDDVEILRKCKVPTTFNRPHAIFVAHAKIKKPSQSECNRRFKALGIMNNCDKDDSDHQCMCETPGFYGLYMCCLEEVCAEYGLEVGSEEGDQRLAVPCVVDSTSRQVTLSCPAQYSMTNFDDVSTMSSLIETLGTTTTTTTTTTTDAASTTPASTLATRTSMSLLVDTLVPSETGQGGNGQGNADKAATIGLGVGLGVGVSLSLVALGFTIFFLRRQRKQNRPAEDTEPPAPPAQPSEAVHEDAIVRCAPHELGSAEKGPSELAAARSPTESSHIIYELPGDSRTPYGRAV